MSQRHNLTPNRELIALYRKVFATEEGQEVLTHMFYDLGIFVEQPRTEAEAALKNYGVRLLNILSGSEPSAHAIKEFCRQLVRQPLPQRKGGI